MVLLFLPAVSAREVTLSADTLDEDSPSGRFVWLKHPECAAVLLDPPGVVEYPLSIHTAQVFFGSTGAHEGQSFPATLAIQVLTPDEEPLGALDPASWSWPEAPFWLTASISQPNELDLDDNDSGLYALTMTEPGRLLVFLCPPEDEKDQAPSWPREDGAFVGLLTDTDGASASSLFFSGLHFIAGKDAGLSGDWGIRLLGDDVRIDAPLAINALAPRTALLGESVALTIQGLGLNETAEVTIGDLPLLGTAVVDGVLTGHTPADLPAGTHDVVVSLSDGQTERIKQAFTVTEATGCGCGSGGAPGLAAVLVGLIGLRHRRGG